MHTRPCPVLASCGRATARAHSALPRRLRHDRRVDAWGRARCRRRRHDRSCRFAVCRNFSAPAPRGAGCFTSVRNQRAITRARTRAARMRRKKIGRRAIKLGVGADARSQAREGVRQRCLITRARAASSASGLCRASRRRFAACSACRSHAKAGSRVPAVRYAGLARPRSNECSRANSVGSGEACARRVRKQLAQTRC